MLITTIASGELTPKTREAVESAINRFNATQTPDAPYQFVTAACWMDDVRGRTKEFNEWHHVNLPFTRDGKPVPVGSQAAPDVIWAINHCVGVMRGEIDDPSIDRDQALVMLLHLVGDIHQPLHATSRDDLGGNKQGISNLRDEQVDLLFSKGGNLHFFWDSAYRRVFENGDAAVSIAPPLYPVRAPVAGHQQALDLAATAASDITKKFPKESLASGENGTPEDWALESHVLGYDLAYGQLPPPPMANPVRLDATYVNASRACAEKQIALAGHRLAVLLNDLLDPKP